MSVKQSSQQAGTQPAQQQQTPPAPAQQQSAGTAPTPKPQIRDWASI